MPAIDTSFLDGLIVGRVDPQIYAFETNTYPNYLKVGDTYRPIEVRLDEWRIHFPDLIRKFSAEAKVDADTFFRDFAVHNYLERNGFKRLSEDDCPSGSYYSKEFFKDAQSADVQEAIDDICEDFLCNGGKYSFYKFESSRIPVVHHYDRTENYAPRQNQKDTIKRFIEARNQGRKNLLMYAVMRFGKSFTSMCCATTMSAKLVVIVSAKADVKGEWQKTVESHISFSEYIFATKDDLNSSRLFISDTLKAGKRIALFLTLQDLQGDDIKERHAELFTTKINLLIIDETHFGARAQEYGKVLLSSGISKKEATAEAKVSKDAEKLEILDQSIKSFKTDIRLHLSGTPYRILMGSEFKKEDVIAFYQFTDIINDQQKWDKDYLGQDNVKEWDNPYYGFPQMVRFAFNPSKAVREKLESLRKNGSSFAFSALFKPQSITKDNGGKYKKFQNEDLILDLFEVIDGSKQDDSLLSFLDYDRIKKGKMCRHIVCVLPYCASCDALEALLIENKDKFKNLGEYKILNIAGLDNRLYNDTDSVKREISKCESEDTKTLTLTVNRMLTGSTVEQWDTMLFLKDTASPQEYDQAIFRLQNQYIRKYKTEDGQEIKFNMKPQTLLVDFAPDRMFVMQELKSQIYNVNTEKNGNNKLEERIARELEISPIVVLNNNKIERVTPANILDAVREYSRERSVMDEAVDIPADYSLFNDAYIKEFISKLEPINSSKGLSIKPTEDSDIDDDDWNIPDTDTDTAPNQNGDTQDSSNSATESEEHLDKKLATYYSQILFFSFLTETRVKSLLEIIDAIKSSEENKRIAKNVGLNLKMLLILQQKSNPNILSKLDYKIQNINDLQYDTTLQPIERAINSLKKFGRISDSEIVTPAKVAESVVALLPDDAKEGKLLDIAAKQGEFTIALYKRWGDSVKDNIYAIPTSTITYEFTRKIYSLLGMPIENVYSNFNSYSLVNEDNEIVKNNITQLLNMNFKAVVGNPPYQLMDGGSKASATPLYNLFVDLSIRLSRNYVSIIMPSRWMTGGKGLDAFRSMMLSNKHIQILHDFTNAGVCFDNVEIKGGICYFLYNSKHIGKCKVHFNSDYSDEYIELRDLFSGDEIFIRDGRLISILEKVRAKNEKSFASIVSEMKPYGIRGDLFNNESKYHLPKLNTDRLNQDDIAILGLDSKQHRIYKYAPKGYPLPKSNGLAVYKIFVPRNFGIGRMGDTPYKQVIANPNEACTETFIQIFPFKNRQEADNCCSYMYTKLFRLLVSIKKNDQGAGRNVYEYCPLQDFSHPWTNALLFEKYNLSSDEIEFINSIIKD